MKNLETYIKIKKIVFNEIREKALSLNKRLFCKNNSNPILKIIHLDLERYSTANNLPVKFHMEAMNMKIN